jgi:hypothetical protein
MTRCALADDHRIGGPDREGDAGGEFLRRSATGARIVLPVLELLRAHRRTARAVRRCRLPFSPLGYAPK